MPAPHSSSSLADHAAAVFKLLADTLAATSSDSDCATLQERFRNALGVFERSAQDGGCSLEHAAQAQFALVAVIDERIMLSELAAKDEWLSSPLQLAYYDEVTAGEEFYNRIDAHRAARLSDVLEIYWMALAFGFAGKYGDKKGSERRRALIDSLALEICSARGVDMRAPLSPQATAAAAARANLPAWPLLRWPWWVVPLAALLLIGGTWVFATMLANARAADLAAAAAKGGAL